MNLTVGVSGPASTVWIVALSVIAVIVIPSDIFLRIHIKRVHDNPSNYPKTKFGEWFYDHPMLLEYWKQSLYLTNYDTSKDSMYNNR